MNGLNHKKRIYLVFIAVFLAAFAIGSLAGAPIKKMFSDSILEMSAKGKTINILFMGIDDRENKNNSRSDTMIVVSIDPKNQKMVMVSVPRDTRIKDGLGRSEKINSINYTKGPEAACKVVSDLLGVPVNYYVITNFAGFGKIVDILGGVDLDVETNMVHWDVSYSINLKKGYQHLNGDQALQYVRYRGGPTADIGRTQRQQKFIKALAKQMFQAKTVLTLPELIPEIAKNVETNIPSSDMFHLAKLAKSVDTSTINAQTLPGYPYTDPGSGASYWEPDREKAKVIIATLMEGQNFAVVGDPPSWINKAPEKYVSKELPTADVLQEQDELSTIDPETQSTDGSGDKTEIETGTGTDSQEPGTGTSTDGVEELGTGNGDQNEGIEELPSGTTDSPSSANTGNIDNIGGPTQ
ncbi:MAG: LCP family protein [Syntrophomonadaceae bacterium]|nr:LCP family protein [Syntrophomonadaceae bacterium]